jgi:sodium transport system permease protein
MAFVAAPALFMAVVLNTRPALGLSLRWPKKREIGLAAVLAVLLLPPLTALAWIVFNQYPHLTKLLEDRQPLMQELRAFSEGLPLQQEQVVPYMLVFALLPALCEELAFRGFILAGLLKNFRPRTAVVLSSFLFALFHMNVFQFLPAFFLGVVLGLLTIRSRSLVPAIMFHLLHNAALLGGIHLVAQLEDYAPEFIKRLWHPFIFVCLAIALALLWWLYRKPYVELERELAMENRK